MFDRIVSRVERRQYRAARPTTFLPATANAWLITVTFGAASLVGTALAQHPVATQDLSPHRVQFVQVEPNVKVEVLDWGGSGRSLILLAGLGRTAHDFDQFATKLTTEHRVYGITRRGFGASDHPPTVNGNYSAGRLGDDVLAVCEAMKLDRPVLVGHSIAGEELSSVATHHPEKVSAVIYLDAGYDYAYYDPSRGSPWIDSLELRRKLEQLIPGKGPESLKQVANELLVRLPAFEATLREWRKYLEVMPPLPTSVEPVETPGQAVLEGQQRFAAIRVPALAIYAIPKNLGGAFENNPVARSAAEAAQVTFDGAQAAAFSAAVPSARVIVLPHASHFVFRSNEADVLREMHAFLASLDSSAR
jgi:non-heme chloroperoxidase